MASDRRTGPDGPYAPRVIKAKIPVTRSAWSFPQGQDDQPDPGGHRRGHLDRGRRHDLHRTPTAHPRRRDRRSISPTRSSLRSVSDTGHGRRDDTSVRSVSLPRGDGLLHVSQLRKIAGGKRVENVEDVVKVGEKIQVEIAEIDSRGKHARARTRRRHTQLAERSRVGPAQGDRSAGRRPAGRQHATLLRRGTAADSSAAPSWRTTSSPKRCRRCVRSPSASGSALAPGRLHPWSARRTISNTCCSRAPGDGTLSRSPQPSTGSGGEMNAFTAKEYTCYYARVLDNDLPLADGFCDMVTSSLIAGADVDSERGVILEEIAMHDDEPGGMFTTCSPRPSSGTRRLVDRCSAAWSRSRCCPAGIAGCYRRCYRPGALASPPRATSTTPRSWGWCARPSSRPVRWAPRTSARCRPGSHGRLVRLARVEDGSRSCPAPPSKPISSSAVGVARTDDRRFALRRPAPLGHELAAVSRGAEKRGLAYSVYNYASHAETGLFGVYVGCLPRRWARSSTSAAPSSPPSGTRESWEEELARGKGSDGPHSCSVSRTPAPG